MSKPETLQSARSAGWVHFGTKVDSDGNIKDGMVLETTGEVIWFDHQGLEVTFK
jgi:hypothetical protein